MPAEIAVSIMAEIVQEKNRHFRTYCDEEVEAAVRRRTPGTMVTIIEKKGSSPRGTGSKMFVFRDGRHGRKHRRRKSGVRSRKNTQ